MPTYYYSNYSSSQNSGTFGRTWTPAVKALILTNVVVFILQAFFPRNEWFAMLSLQLPEMISQNRYWQPFSYLFLHGGFWHLFFNMFTLWMFGCEVEAVLGTPRFLAYYLLTGIGAGWCVAGVGHLFHETSLTVGASGAIFGILIAYGILFAERVLTLLVFFIIPVQMKAKTMVWVFAAIEFVAGVSNAFSQVSHLAHLSGLFIGFLFFWFTRPAFRASLNPWKEFKWWHLRKRVRTITPRENPELYVEEILEKISKQGIGALSAREREIMAQAAKRRQRNDWPGNN